MFVCYFLIVPTAAVNNSDLLTQVLATAYPIWSLSLLGGVIALLLRSPEPNDQSTLILLSLGIGFFLASDLSFGYASLAGTYAVGSWIDAGWNIAQVFAVLAALRQMQIEPISGPERSWGWIREKLARVLPVLAILLAYALVVYVVIENNGQAAEWLMAGALLLTLLVIARQIASPNFADLPVRAKVILTFIMVSVLSVSLVSTTAYLTIRSDLESLAGNSLKAYVEIQAQTIGNEISKQLDLMEGFVLGETIEGAANASNARYTRSRVAIATRLEQQDLAWKAALDTDPLVQEVLNNRVAGELYKLQKGFPTHTNILLTDKYGATIAATTRPATYSQSAEEWWQEAYNQGKGALYLGQPMYDPTTHTLRIIIAVPVHAHLRPEVIGIIRTTYLVDNIFEVLAPSHMETTNGYVLLLPDGKLLDAQGDMRTLDSATMARLQASQSSDYAELDFGGTLQLVSQARVSSPDAEDAEALIKLNWILINHKQPASAFAPLYAVWRIALLTTFLVLFLTSGVAVILAQLLVAPISRLTHVASQIAAGNLTTQAEVESKDEIGTLASTFNMMVQALSQTRLELQESEALYRSLVEYSPDMILVLNEDKVLFMNPAGVKLLGANSADELISQPVLNIIPPQDLESTREGIAQVWATRLPTPLLQQKMHRLNGTSFEAEFRAIPISYGGQQAIQVVMRDITERKRLEEQWQKFKLGIEHSTEAVFMTDVDGTIRYVNPAFEKLYGYFWDEAVGQTPRILKSGKIDQETYQHFWETLLAKGSTSGELVNRTKDGRLINIEGSATPILDHDGSLVGFLAVQRDVTERKKAEEKIHQLLSQVARQRGDLEIRVAERTEELNSLNQLLKSELIERQRLVQSLSDSETRFRLLFESSPDAILLIDPNDPATSWPIVDCNEVACTMNGYTRQELIGQSVDLLNAAPGNPAERMEYLEYLRSEGVLHRDGFHRHKDGHIFPIAISSSIIHFGGRELVLGIDRDITERKRAEEELSKAKDLAEAASRAKSEFLSRMSHELRTPMNAILGFAQLLEMSQKEPLSSTQKERVKQISKGGQHLLDLINEILDISRIEANRMQVSPEPVSVRESVEEVLDLSVPLAVKRHIQIVTRFGGLDANPFVLADRQRLKQVLLNLVGNAVKYNYDGGSVIISCQQTSAKKWRIAVADSGPGISQENLARLFIPFERLNGDQPNVEGLV
jgi:PAS domain S-box-containing protein